MSKKNQQTSSVTNSLLYANAIVIPEDAVGDIVGRLLTFVETLGFDEGRLKAVKDVIKRECYAILDRAWIIGGEEHQKIMMNASRTGQYSIGGHTPPQFPEGVV